jgi:hypothetical protein
LRPEGDPAEDLISGFRQASCGYARKFAQKLLDVGVVEHQFVEVVGDGSSIRG